MNLPTLQSLISNQRNTLRELHALADYSAAYRKHYYDTGHIVRAEICHKDYVKATKRIAQLARVQRALKVEMAETIECERFLRHHDISAIAYGQYDDSQL